MSDITTNQAKLYLIRALISSRTSWLDQFSGGRSKRPDHEISQKRAELVVMKAIAEDYEGKLR